MLRLCKKSNINSYLWNIEGGFHHKLIELLACKNPVIVYPGEFPESTNIVKETNSILHICRTSNDIVENLNRIYYQYIDGHNNELQIDMSGYTWDSQTVKIEKIFKNIVNTEV